MSYQAGTYEVCCECGVLIPLQRLKEHPVLCQPVQDDTYPEFLDSIYGMNTKDLTSLLVDWLASTQIEGLSWAETQWKIMAIGYELELRAMGGNE